MNQPLVFLVILLFTTLILPAQNLADLDVLEVYDEKTEANIIGIYADNKADCPISVVIDFPQKKNVKIGVKLPFTIVLPPKSERFHVMDIETFPGKAASFQYGYSFALGDSQSAKHNDDYVYDLPFEKGKKYLVGQGYRGHFSHQNINAIDFNMDIGSKVCAARGGVVAFVKEDSKIGCLQERCKDDANYILIYHDDGSFGQYVHLKHKGVCVKPGQKVVAGEVIAYSGDTGWSSGPHLHFEVLLPQGLGYMTLPTHFRTAGEKRIYLEEGKEYVK